MAGEPPRVPDGAAERQIRGSSLLLLGRFGSIAVTLIVQIITVRYLSQRDYGALAWANAIVALVESVITLGLDRAVSRYAPIYHEGRDYPRLLGTVWLAFGSIISLALAAFFVLYGTTRVLGVQLVEDQLAVDLLLLLVVMAPLQALDHLMEILLAVFATPRAIFIRRYVVTPLFKLGTVLVVVAIGANVFGLAVGSIVAGIVGVVVYVSLLTRIVRQEQSEHAFSLREAKIPARELFAFSLPLLSTDVTYVVRNTLDAVLLAHFQGTAEVAVLRAVQPTARLNQLVFTTFGLLFVPLASRLFARKDDAALDDLYWQTATWQAVISFPVFAMTFALADPLAVILFGEDYAASGPILAILSFGYYFNAALGQNSLMLRVFGDVRYIVVGNFLAAALNLALAVILIPTLGAAGAAISLAASLIAINLYNQVGLARKTTVQGVHPAAVRVYVTIGLAAGLLLLISTLPLPLAIHVALAVIGSAAVLWINRSALRLAGTFPELGRIPIIRRICR
jgi:O-antigen/teichoic acid export membrane protein